MQWRVGLGSSASSLGEGGCWSVMAGWSLEVKKDTGGIFKSAFLRFYLFIFRERGRERDISQVPLAHPQSETWPATQACALTGN